MHLRPPEPNVRSDADAPGDWHLAGRVRRDGSVIVRRSVAPLARPLDWRYVAPEVSLGARMCPSCIAVAH